MHSRQPAPMVESLTPRELDILRLIAEGLTNGEICQRLHLELSTVKSYNTQIFGKLSVKNRREAVVRGRILGLVDVGVLDLPKNNLPAQTTPFIGREAELTDLAQLLADPDLRLITVLAPGGMGKTRLVLELAERIVETDPQVPSLLRFPNGVFFVSLAPLRDPEHIVSAIAEATGFQFMQDERDPKQQVLDFLSNKQMLLILDNFEHLLDGASIITDILNSAPDVRVIATSREKLSLRGEKVYAVTGMIFPDWETPEDALQYDAVRLFLQTAQLAATGFKLVPDNLKYLARICRLVEGMPLAIILAAAWVEVLSLEEIAEEISTSIDFLAAEMRDTPRRQWSIRAVFEPTWQRLTDTERDTFMRFSVFRGGATRNAAQTVTGADLRTLQSLVNKALIWRGPGGRYEMHDLLRQYAEAKLEETGETESARDAHSAYYLNALAEREADLKGRDQLGALNDIESDFENVKAAWYWGVERKDYEGIDRAVLSLSLFCEWRRPAQDGIMLFGKAREVFAPQPNETPHPVWGKVLLRHHEDYQIPGSDSRPRIEQCLEIARKNTDQREIGICYRFLVFKTDFREWPQEAIKLLKESLAGFQAINDQFNVTIAYADLAYNHYMLAGDRDNAITYWQQALEISQEIGHKILESVCLQNLGTVEWLSSGDTANSEVSIRQALSIARETGNLSQIAFNTSLLSDQLSTKGDFEQGRILIEEALAIWSEIEGASARDRWGYKVARVEDMEENYAEAIRLCEASRPFFDKDNHYLVSIERWLSLAACGLGDYPRAQKGLITILYYTVRRQFIVWTITVLPVAAIIEAHTGAKEHAVELLGLAFTHPSSPWMEKWPLLTRLRADLRADLGDDAYHAAWERGRQLDLETVVQELLADYERDEERN
jgi:predicted ATPase/DNA-binding CsgD family transcriptional regulator